jgi:uncharacterized protein GlcG (DUF336 family)
MGVGRPGKASSAAGISSFFRNVNMSASPAYRRNISLGGLRRSRNCDHVFRCRATAIRGLARKYAGCGPRSGAILPPTSDKEQAVFLAALTKVCSRRQAVRGSPALRLMGARCFLASTTARALRARAANVRGSDRFHQPDLPLIVPAEPRRAARPVEVLQMPRMLALAGALVALALAAGPATAQQPAGTAQTPPPPYGPPITLDQAKRVMAAAELEAAKNSWQVAIAILDSGGNMVMFHKFDNTQLASIGASEGKANTALRFKRPSKALDDAIAAGGAGLRLLAVKDITPLEGGLPVMLDGKIIGAIGVSGALSSQDAQVARAGVAAVVK